MEKGSPLFFSRLKAHTPYFTKFSVVGISGILVNEGLLALLTEVLDVRVRWAGVIAIES